MKKAFFILFIFAFSFTQVSALTFTTETKTSISNQDKTPTGPQPESITDKIPDFIKKPFQKLYDFTETARLGWKDSLAESKVVLETKISDDEKAIDKDLKTQEEADPDTYKKTTYVNSTHGNAIQRAIDHIVLFFYNVFLFIMTSVLTFYGLIVLLLILIIRFIWNHLL